MATHQAPAQASIAMSLLKIKQNIEQGRMVGLISLWPSGDPGFQEEAQLNLPVNMGQVPHPAQVATGGLSNILCQITRINLTAVKRVKKYLPRMRNPSLWLHPWLWHLPGKWIVKPLVQLKPAFH